MIYDESLEQEMELLEDILKKMELPLSFAVGDSYNHLPQIKNLELFLISLTRRFREEIIRDVPESHQSQLDRLSIALRNLLRGCLL